MAKKIEPPKLGHVVSDTMIGNTRCIICDDYVVKTPEEVQAILDRIGKNATMHLLAAGKLEHRVPDHK